MPTRCAAPAMGSAVRTAATPAGNRHRGWDRAGRIGLAIPKLREGTCFPEWLLERRRRAESALVSVMATSYLLGVSTRRMEKLVESYPKWALGWVKALLHSVYDQPDAEALHAQFERILDALADKLPAVRRIWMRPGLTS
jgi:transposase-like protein